MGAVGTRARTMGPRLDRPKVWRAHEPARAGDRREQTSEARPRLRRRRVGPRRGPCEQSLGLRKRSARKACMAASQQDLGCLLGGIRGPP